MADFGKVSGGKGGKGSRGKRSRNFKSPIAKISGRKKGGAPDYQCKFEVDIFHVAGGRGSGTTYGDALLGTFSDGRRNDGLMRALTGATQIMDVPDIGLASGNTQSFTFRLDAGDLFGGSNGNLANTYPNTRFEISVDGPSGDGIHWEGYESRHSSWGNTQSQLTFTLQGPSAAGASWNEQMRVDGSTCHLKVWFNGDDNPFNLVPRFTP